MLSPIVIWTQICILLKVTNYVFKSRRQISKAKWSSRFRRSSVEFPCLLDCESRCFGKLVPWLSIDAHSLCDLCLPQPFDFLSFTCSLALLSRFSYAPRSTVLHLPRQLALTSISYALRLCVSAVRRLSAPKSGYKLRNTLYKIRTSTRKVPSFVSQDYTELSPTAAKHVLLSRLASNIYAYATRLTFTLS